MGMFDTFHMGNIEMPDLTRRSEDFQTKDLDGQCNIYRLTPDGRVMRKEPTWEDVDGEARPVSWVPADLTCRIILRGPLTLRATFNRGMLIALETYHD